MTAAHRSLSRRSLLASAGALATVGTAARRLEAGGGLKAAFLYIGPLDGDLWSYAHDQGRREMARQTGIETAFTQSVTAGDAEGVLREYARQGYGVIFSTTFDFVEATLRVAREFPNVIFEQATGVQTAPNVGTYNGRMEQAWYLAGIVAGGMTRAGTLGYVAPYPIPEVVRHLNAFTLGARSANPAVRVQPRWIFTWFDPPTEEAAARALAGDGADVIASEADSDAANLAADALELTSIGYNAVLAGEPASLLTAPVWRWDVYYAAAVRDILAGRWTNAPVWWGMPQGLVELAPISPRVPAALRDRVEAARARIVAGALEPFTGPIADNTGRLRIPAGRSVTDAELLSMDWLVEGVVGPLPSMGASGG